MTPKYPKAERLKTENLKADCPFQRFSLSVFENALPSAFIPAPSTPSPLNLPSSSPRNTRRLKELAGEATKP